MKIVTCRKFDKSFKKQPAKVKREFEKRIRLFYQDIHNSTLNTHKLSGNLKNLWSFNVTGDIRVVFDKSQKDVIILVTIGSHSELYS